jgi:hypothetical protein
MKDDKFCALYGRRVKHVSYSRCPVSVVTNDPSNSKPSTDRLLLEFACIFFMSELFGKSFGVSGKISGSKNNLLGQTNSMV